MPAILMIKPSSLQKINEFMKIKLQWNTNIVSHILINPITQKIQSCTTINQITNKTVQSILTNHAMSLLFKKSYFISNNNSSSTTTTATTKKINEIVYPAKNMQMSHDMTRISFINEDELLGGGCVSSNNNNSKSNKMNRINKNNINNDDNNNNLEIRQKEKKQYKINQDEICTTDHYLIDLSNKQSQQIDLQNEIFPYLNKIIKNNNTNIDYLTNIKLLNILMLCLEYALLDARIIDNSNNNSISFNPSSIKQFLLIIKKLQNYLDSNKNNNPLSKHIIILSWLKLVLKFNKSEKLILTTTCNESDCLLFSIKLDSQEQIYQPDDQLSCISEAEDIIEKQSVLFNQKNPIFHLLAYRKILQQNYTACSGSFINLMDQIIFAHHKSFNKLKSHLQFDARFYSLLTLSTLLSSLSELQKQQQQNQQQQQQQLSDQSYPSQNQLIYANTFLFNKEEGIITICEQELKLKDNNNTNSNESVKLFLQHHESYRFIASEIIKKTQIILLKHHLSNTNNNNSDSQQQQYHQLQIKYVNELINQREKIEQSNSVKLILAMNYHNTSPTHSTSNSSQSS